MRQRDWLHDAPVMEAHCCRGSRTRGAVGSGRPGQAVCHRGWGRAVVLDDFRTPSRQYLEGAIRALKNDRSGSDLPIGLRQKVFCSFERGDFLGAGIAVSRAGQPYQHVMGLGPEDRRHAEKDAGTTHRPAHGVSLIERGWYRDDAVPTSSPRSVEVGKFAWTSCFVCNVSLQGGPPVITALAPLAIARRYRSDSAAFDSGRHTSGAAELHELGAESGFGPVGHAPRAGRGHDTRYLSDSGLGQIRRVEPRQRR